jgi:integrase
MPARQRTSGRTAEDDLTALGEGSDDKNRASYRVIARDLRGAIQSGILSPGDALPSENSIAANYQVAPSTAHRAVALLAAEGGSTASSGLRTVVLPSSTSEASD